MIAEVHITTLNSRQFAVILNPVNPTTGKPQLGARKLVKGETNFFLQPGEELEGGIQNVYILADIDGLILRAKEAFNDGVSCKNNCFK